MNIFEYKLNSEMHIPNSISHNFLDKNICFFDIETTGLSSKYNQIVLIGVLCKQNDNVYIKQFFADNIDEEIEVLTLFNEFINNFEYIISYNGKSFDIPFLKNRFAHHNIISDIDKVTHLDLLQIVRKNKKLLNLDDCKLKTVEKRLNIYREDTISGKESVELYKAYMYSKDIVKRDIILKHNYDDIFYLPKLLSIYDIIEKESSLISNIVFKDMTLELNINKSSIQFQKSKATITGNATIIEFPPQVYYKDFYSFSWSTSEGFFELQLFYKVASLSDGLKCFYLDLKDNEFLLNDFGKMNYNIPDHLILLKIDEVICYDNIILLIKKIFSQVN